MRRAIAIAAFVLASRIAGAQTLPTCAAPIPDPLPRDATRITWTPPTQNTDGSLIGAAVKTFTVYENSVSAANARCTTGASAMTLTALPVGPHSWVVTTTVAGVESAASNSAAKTIAPGIPNPPTSVTVAGDPAFTPQTTRDALVMLEVGKVPGGIVPSATQYVSAFSPPGLYCLVPHNVVQFLPGADAEAIYVSCGG